MVHYVKDAFLNGRTFIDLADLNAQALHWLNHTANTRIHSTTGDVLSISGFRKNSRPWTR